MILRFQDWKKLNESETAVNSDLAEYFLKAWTEIKFPWEEKLVEALETFKEALDKFQGYNLNQRTKQSYSSRGDTVAFNIKYYDGPDIKKIQNMYTDFSEDAIYDMFSQYMNDQLEFFVDNLDYSWISDVFQDGRSGGWLVITLDGSFSPSELKELVTYDLENYNDEISEIKSSSKEELEKLRGTRMGRKFGLNESMSREERVKELEYAESECEKVIKAIKFEEERAWEVLSGLEQIQKDIEAGMSGLTQGFEEHLKAN